MRQHRVWPANAGSHHYQELIVKNVRPPTAVMLLAGVLGAGCQSAQWGGAGEAWQANECRKIIDVAERKRCLDSNAATFEEFRRQQQARTKP